MFRRRPCRNSTLPKCASVLSNNDAVDRAFVARIAKAQRARRPPAPRRNATTTTVGFQFKTLLHSNVDRALCQPLHASTTHQQRPLSLLSLRVGRIDNTVDVPVVEICREVAIESAMSVTDGAIRARARVPDRDHVAAWRQRLCRRCESTIKLVLRLVRRSRRSS